MSVTLLREPGNRHSAIGRRSLEDEILHALNVTGYHQLHELQIRIDGDRVHVLGHLPSYYLKQKALHAVLSVPGVGTVVDEIDITC